MTPVLVFAIVGLVVFLGWAAWQVRSSKQPLSSIDSFSRALEAMEPEDGAPVNASPDDV